jgi:hypothetical protein
LGPNINLNKMENLCVGTEVEICDKRYSKQNLYYIRFHLTQMYINDTSEENTTRYWREQQAWGKLQTKQNNGLTNIKSKLLQQRLGNKGTVWNKWTVPLVR